MKLVRWVAFIFTLSYLATIVVLTGLFVEVGIR